MSAIITNLADEAHLVARMHDALASQMNAGRNCSGPQATSRTSPDYELARSQGLTAPPLPVLFIVVDEFSELLSQHPGFAELSVAIGRLGRSLGKRLDDAGGGWLETHLSSNLSTAPSGR